VLAWTPLSPLVSRLVIDVLIKIKASKTLINVVKHFFSSGENTLPPECTLKYAYFVRDVTNL